MNLQALYAEHDYDADYIWNYDKSRAQIKKN
jgi:hypothetical protein